MRPFCLKKNFEKVPFCKLRKKYRFFYRKRFCRFKNSQRAQNLNQKDQAAKQK
ncbi:hypothetical protein LEP1GSC163_1693 [Leptospira santarosai str. CBC379]|nr:hypothetical protein LEP1GSC163_1693 [Leptospira santarosai str. CBC379]